MPWLTARAGAQDVPKEFVRDRAHEVSVRAVLVDVIATRKDGAFVTGLGKDDFRVFEDGKEVPVRSAEIVSFLEPEPGGPAAGPTREKHFVVIFDSINTIKRMLDRSKAEILEKLLSIVRLGREIMILELGEKDGLKLIQPLTSDPALIAGAVEKAAGSIWVEKAADSLAVPNILSGGAIGRPASEVLPGATKFEEFARDQYESETRRRFEKTINGLLAALNDIKDLPGRKSVLFVSGGIPSISFVKFFGGTSDPISDATISQSQVAAAKVMDPFKGLNKAEFRSGQEIMDDLIRYANTHNISFYALDPDNYLRFVLGDMAYDNYSRSAYGLSSLRRSGIQKPDDLDEIKRIETSKLKLLAEDTGGRSFLGGDRFDEFQRTVERDLGQYYELSYTPGKKVPDGKYHEISVKTTKPGVNVRFRRGYFDYTPSQRETLLFSSAAYTPSLFRGILFDARVIPFIQGKDKIALWISMALPVASVLDASADPEKPVDLKFNVTVGGPDRGKAYASEATIPVRLPPAFLKSLRNASYFGYSCSSQETKLAADTYRAVVALYNGNIGQMGTAECLFEVADAAKSGPAILAAVLGGLGKDAKPGGASFALSKEDGTLFVAGLKFHPMAVNRLEAGKRGSVFLQVAAPGGKPGYEPRFSLLRDGVMIGTAPARLVEGAMNKKAGVWNAVYEFALEPQYRGDYVLRLLLTDPADGTSVEKRVDIRVF